MFVTAFTDLDVFLDHRDTLTADRAKLGRFVAGMHDAGVRVIGRGLWYISAVHTDAEIDHAIATARDVLSAMD
jgi:glutamate-1-semialdehyde 2,1-aminomutase